MLPPVSVSRHSIPQLHWNVRGKEGVIEREPHRHTYTYVLVGSGGSHSAEKRGGESDFIGDHIQ